MSRSLPAILAAFSLAVLNAGGAWADIGKAVKCEAARLKLAAKYASCTLKAQAAAVGKQTAVDLSGCVQKFDDKCASVEAKYGADCPATPDCASMRDIAQCASDLLPGSGEPVTTAVMNDEHVYFDDAVNRRIVDVVATFPSLATSYSSVVMHLALSCPTGGCDVFARRGSVAVMQNPGPSEVAIEIARFVAPYGVGASWDVDVTDLRPLLDGSRTIRVFIDTWVGPGSVFGAGWLVDMSFEHTPGTPARRAIAAVPVYAPQQVVYGDPAHSITSQIGATGVAVPSGATSLDLRSFITGHGQGNAANCAEFCQRDHTFTIDGTPSSQTIWRSDCASTAAPGQMGTYAYSRAGWCTGAVVHDWTFDVPVPVDGTVDVSYDVEPYENTCRPDAAVCTGCTLGTGCEYDGGAHTEPFYDVSALLIAFE